MKATPISSLTFVLVLVMLMIGLFACDQLGQILVPPEPGAEGLPIGVVLPLSGYYAATFGEPMLSGFKLAAEEINGSRAPDDQLKIIPKDDGATVEGAVTAFNTLIEAYNVPVILGPGFSSQFKETSLVANEHGVVGFSSTSSASGINEAGDFNFRAGLITSRLNPPGVMITKEVLKYERVATIFDGADTYSTIGHDDLTEALTANNVNIVATEEIDSKSGEIDFSDLLGRLMESNPQAIFASVLAGEMTPILIQSRELGITPSVHLIIPEFSNIEVDALVEAGMGEAAEGVISFTGWSSLAATPGNQVFIENYRTAYGADPNPWAAQSYATLHILAAAMEEAQSTDAAAIRDALANTMDFETILGKFSFDEVGDAVYDPQILIVKDGEFAVFE